MEYLLEKKQENVFKKYFNQNGLKNYSVFRLIYFYVRKQDFLLTFWIKKFIFKI